MSVSGLPVNLKGFILLETVELTDELKQQLHATGTAAGVAFSKTYASPTGRYYIVVAPHGAAVDLNAVKDILCGIDGVANAWVADNAEVNWPPCDELEDEPEEEQPDDGSDGDADGGERDA